MLPREAEYWRYYIDRNGPHPYLNLYKIRPDTKLYESVDIVRHLQARGWSRSETLGHYFASRGYLDGLNLVRHRQNIAKICTTASIYGHLNILRAYPEFRLENFILGKLQHDFNRYTIRYFLQQGGDPNSEILIAGAIESNDLKTVQYLRKRGSSLICFRSIERACGLRNLEMVRYLVESGCPLERGFFTSLVIRCRDVFEYFLDIGINPGPDIGYIITTRNVEYFRSIVNRKIRLPENILARVAITGQIEMLRMLIEAGYDRYQEAIEVSFHSNIILELRWAQIKYWFVNLIE